MYIHIFTNIYFLFLLVLISRSIATHFTPFCVGVKQLYIETSLFAPFFFSHFPYEYVYIYIIYIYFMYVNFTNKNGGGGASTKILQEEDDNNIRKMAQ